LPVSLKLTPNFSNDRVSSTGFKTDAMMIFLFKFAFDERFKIQLTNGFSSLNF